MKFEVAKLKRDEAYRLMIGSIIPRPIAFVSTIGKSGITNLAPFSFFNGMDSKPAIITIAIGTRRLDGKRVPKDTLMNIQETGEFVVNTVSRECEQKMVQCSESYPPEVSEIETVGFSTLPSDIVKAPRIAESPINMECKLRQCVSLEGVDTTLVIGEILLYHVCDEILRDGFPDPNLWNWFGRLGADLYSAKGHIFPLNPKDI